MVVHNPEFLVFHGPHPDAWLLDTVDYKQKLTNRDDLLRLTVLVLIGFVLVCVVSSALSKA